MTIPQEASIVVSAEDVRTTIIHVLVKTWRE